MMKLRKGDNRGFSLVELIVVILIMGVLSAGAVASVSAIYYADAERAAKKITTMMTTARTLAMTEDAGEDTAYIKFKLWQEDGDFYAGIYFCEKSGETWTETLKEPASPEKISSYRVNILVGPKNSIDSNRTQIDGDNVAANCVEYTFKKSSGGIRKSKLGNLAALTGESIYADIIVSGSSSYKLIVVPATGRCYLGEEL